MEIILGAIILFIGLVAGFFLGKSFSSKSDGIIADAKLAQQENIILKTRLEKSEEENQELSNAKKEIGEKFSTESERRIVLEKQVSANNSELDHKNQALNELKAENLKLKEIHENQNSKLLNAEKKLSSLESDLKSELDKQKEHEKKVQDLKTQFGEEFKNLANQIFEEKSKSFSEKSEKDLKTLLTPLKDKIGAFQQKVEETYASESKERFALKKEIEKIVEANQKITDETNNLTRALKGDVKAQGNWGELVLQKVLESSGLREGEEFIVQGKDLGLKDEEGKSQKPDVIVMLPDERSIIVDSKVSLLHYEAYIASETKDLKDKFIKDFCKSIRAHIEGLSGKQYHLNEKLYTPEFVFMFFPIEGAFSIAVQHDQEIIRFAWEKQVAIVSPTTLIANLKSIDSIWKRERQNKNALQIAHESGNLYNKFAGFLEDLEKIGNSIKKSDQHYEEALKKLYTGNGNILRRVEKIKELGAKTGKKLPSKFAALIETDIE